MKLLKKLSLCCLFSIFLSVSNLSFAGSCPIKSDTNFAYYGGNGACTDCQAWWAYFLNWWQGANPSMKYVELDAKDVKNDCNISTANYPNLVAYIQPGGDAYQQQSTLGGAGRNNIASFISGGGGYIGTCAGWYYAAADYYYANQYYAHPNLLGYAERVEGSIESIAKYPANKLISVQDTTNNNYTMLYWGGPTTGYQHTNQTSSPELLTFKQVGTAHHNKDAAIEHYKMILTSVHPEAYGNGLTWTQITANYRWLARSINDTMGTTFAIP